MMTGIMAILTVFYLVPFAFKTRTATIILLMSPLKVYQMQELMHSLSYLLISIASLGILIALLTSACFQSITVLM